MASNQLNVVDIQISTIDLTASAPDSAINPSLLLNFSDTYLRHIKAVKRHLDPVSDCIGFIGGIACCCMMIFVQADENQRPATRRDAVYAQQERARDRRELGDSFELGFCIGNTVVDMSAITLGGACCFFPSLYRSQCQPLSSNDNVLGISADEINTTHLFDCCGTPS